MNETSQNFCKIAHDGLDKITCCFSEEAVEARKALETRLASLKALIEG